MSDQSTLGEFDALDMAETTERDPADDKLYRNEEWLREQYCEQEKSTIEIGDNLGISNTTVSKWLKKYGIETRHNSKSEGDTEPLRDEDWLREQYIEREKTSLEIADELEIDSKTVRNWMGKHGIEMRSQSDAQTDGNTTPLKDEAWLREQYLTRKRSLGEIADELGITAATVNTWKDKHGIESRSKSEARLASDYLYNEQTEQLRDEDWLREQYVEKKRTIADIADGLELSSDTVASWMDRHDIEARSPSEARLAAKSSYSERTNLLYDEDWLREQYVERERTTHEIGDEIGVADGTVGDWLDRHGIETRSAREANLVSEHLYRDSTESLRDEEWLREQYCDQQKSQYEIADDLGVYRPTVDRWMDRHEIETRSQSDERTEQLRDEDWLRVQYVEKQRTTREISAEVGVVGETVRYWLDKHGIETRSKVMYPDHLNHRVIGDWELEIANLLHENEIVYTHESLSVTYTTLSDFDSDTRETHTYTPDFVTDEYVIEVKGARWSQIHDEIGSEERKAQAAMNTLSEREYVVIGIELPCDIHISFDEREQLLDLFE
jgi:transposase-like protein